MEPGRKKQVKIQFLLENKFNFNGEYWLVISDVEEH